MANTEILFYLFSSLLVVSAIGVVSFKNSVYGVLSLIFAFVNASFLFVLLKAEFLAMLLVIVYVGAIAVLFLFVVMMLNADKILPKQALAKLKPFHFAVLSLVATLFFLELVLAINFAKYNSNRGNLAMLQEYQFPIDVNVENTNAIGNILYTDFAVAFQLVGAILLVAMIGAILLTLKTTRKDLKLQNIFSQVNRSSKDSISLVKVGSGKGIDL
jgi:NADH-quinone oxidoreductase subunit J